MRVRALYARNMRRRIIGLCANVRGYYARARVRLIQMHYFGRSIFTVRVLRVIYDQFKMF